MSVCECVLENVYLRLCMCSLCVNFGFDRMLKVLKAILLFLSRKCGKKMPKTSIIRKNMIAFLYHMDDDDDEMCHVKHFLSLSVRRAIKRWRRPTTVKMVWKFLRKKRKFKKLFSFLFITKWKEMCDVNKKKTFCVTKYS